MQAAADSMLILLDCPGNPDIKILFIDGKSILKDEIYLRKDNKSRYQVVQHKENTLSIDPDLQAIINYVIFNGSNCGPAEKLGVNAKTANTNGVHIRNLLDRNVGVLKAYFISYMKQNRTTASRRFELRYYGEDSIDDSL